GSGCRRRVLEHGDGEVPEVGGDDLRFFVAVEIDRRQAADEVVGRIADGHLIAGGNEGAVALPREDEDVARLDLHAAAERDVVIEVGGDDSLRIEGGAVARQGERRPVVERRDDPVLEALQQRPESPTQGTQGSPSGVIRELPPCGQHDAIPSRGRDYRWEDRY